MKKALIVLSLVTLVANVSSAAELGDYFERKAENFKCWVLGGAHTFMDKLQDKADEMPRSWRAGEAVSEGANALRTVMPERESKLHKLLRKTEDYFISGWNKFDNKSHRVIQKVKEELNLDF